VLLVAPWVEPQLAALGPADTASAEGLRNFYRSYDISARIDLETGRWVPNSLADLTKRENRFAHAPSFPYGLDLERIRFIQVAAGSESRTPLAPLDAPTSETAVIVDRRGEDVVLTNVLAFDVRAFDPLAPLLLVNNTVVEPSDIGWHTPGNWAVPASNSIVGRGAYVDLAYIGDPTKGDYEAFDVPVGAATSVFSMAPHPQSGFTAIGGLLVRSFYDTWSTHYEVDGINQDNPTGDPNGDQLVDEGANGIDDPQDAAGKHVVDPNRGVFVGGVDDVSERETSPPYLSPLRGLEVKLRIYEPDSRVPREVSVKHNFTP
jgi:hypothetical protein